MRCLVLVPVNRRQVVQAPWHEFLFSKIVTRQFAYTACYMPIIILPIYQILFFILDLQINYQFFSLCIDHIIPDNENPL